MLLFALRRLSLALLVAFGVSVVCFSMLRLSGDPAIAMAGENASTSDIELIRKQYGFDRPLPVQYFEWLRKASTGDFGTSPFFKLPVRQLIAERLPTTAILAICSLVFALVLAIPLGVLAAVNQNSWIDRLALFLAVSGQAIPSFWLGLLLIVWFSINFSILPPSGSEGWEYFIMPTIVLGTHALPAFMRLTRNGMLDVLASDYMRTARAKGLLPRTIIFKHALRNAVIPLVSLTAVQFGFLLGGSVVTESVFALHGLGYLAWESITRLDIPTVQAIVLLIALFYVLLGALADLLNAWLDPRIRVA
jgi:peptide/nickel transport system permease protein